MNADTRPKYSLVSAFILIHLLLLSCSPAATPTLFRPPAPPRSTDAASGESAAPASTFQGTTAATETATAAPCSNGLTFVADATIPDGTIFSPGASIDKQWLVTNSGTCDWDVRYRLKFVGGNPLGAPTEQALYPARAGTQATLRILFTAQVELGTYQTTWQAFDPDGNVFGDDVFMQIVVE